MATYLIGDVQGCFLSLVKLLEKIAFNQAKDKIIFLGDAINRGPRSLETLRFIKSHLSSMELILGNHEIFAIALALGAIKNPRPHTLDAILKAPDKDELSAYLRSRPLIIKQNNAVFVHAGILPAITIDEALNSAALISAILVSDGAKKFLARFYEKPPNAHKPTLGPNKILRLTLAYLTLVRMCDKESSMDLSYTGTLDKAPKRLKPWFMLRNDHEHIYFGHWAALGLFHYNNYHCLDSGCAWGNKLTALCLENNQIFQVENAESS